MLYVDDLQISCQGSDMRLIEQQLQTTVNRLVKWCDQNGLTISPSKSSCVHFCRKLKLHPDHLINIGNIQIPAVSYEKTGTADAVYQQLFSFYRSKNASQAAEIVNDVYCADTVTANYVQVRFRLFRSGIFDVKDAPRS
ncbi:putative RNA-directed DNA polymerase from transposon X-element [Trichonephila clavipes]|nr:putative RNA-directed DNA polymerase from transposon X-element [Trichonephila clavipes]